MTFCDLKNKEVINCKDCKRIGCVVDVEFDSCTGQICGFVILSPIRFWSCFSRNIHYYIRFCDVVRIGPDILLVDVDLEKSIIKE